MMEPTLFQAEEAFLSGPIIATGNNSEGAGYVDYQNAAGEFIEWTIDVPVAGAYDLSWRYANGKSNRPLTLEINSTVTNSNLDFEGTGGWSVWGFATQTVALQAGLNIIRLLSNGSSGANFDYLRVSEATSPLPVNVVISDAIATEGSDNFLDFNVDLSAPSTETITLDLVSTQSTAKGGAIADFGIDTTSDPIDYANQSFEVSTDGGGTWQAANNGTEVSFAAGQTSLKVRLAINDDTTDEGPIAETMTLAVSSVLSGTVSNASDIGTGAILDNDSSAGFDAIFQAEEAFLSGPTIESGNNSEGSGYADYTNATGDFIEWVVEAPTAGIYDLSWRYANGKSNRPLTLAINDAIAQSNLDFSGTGSWTNWDFTTRTVALQAGTNTIRLTANGSSGANFDYLRVTEASALAPVDVSISDAIATEGVDDYLLFDLALSAPSSEAIVLNLVTTDGSAKGGLVADFGIDPEGDPVDYVAQSFEVSHDDGATWQAANNSTEVAFAAGQTALKVRLAINNDGASEGLSAETMTLAVGNVIAGNVGSSSDVGLGSIVDDDGSAGFDAIFQAESALLSGPVIKAGNNSEGAGYADYKNATGDFIEWTIDTPTAGAYDLSWRYANGSSNRPLALAINNAIVESALDFEGTGGWTSWDFSTQTVSLQAGTNTIRLTANGSSGANFDYLRVTETNNVVPTDVVISNAVAIEGTDDFLIFDVGLSSPSLEDVSLDLATVPGTAQGGLAANFGNDLSGNPVDYASESLEFSDDDGATWQLANNGTEVTFAAGQTNLKVRLAINDDEADEGFVAESMSLEVASVLSGTVDSFADVGIGSILDNDGSSGAIGAPISTLPFTDVRVEGNLLLNFSDAYGGLVDKDGEGIGFTMVDPATNAGNPAPFAGVAGYWPEKLDIDTASGVLKIETTSGLQVKSVNSLDNALGVGLNVPSAAVRLQTTLVNLPTPVGGSAQAGLWFGKAEGGGDGSSEDNYIKFVVRSNQPGNYLLEAMMEKNGAEVSKATVDIPEGQSVNLNLFVDPVTETVTAQYSVGSGLAQSLTTFSNVPTEWFSFDQAGINPELATRSFGGIFASDRNAASQVFSFDSFSVTEEAPPPPPPPPVVDGFGPITFDRWSIPVNNATDMSFGPDGKLYVATLFGEIRAIEFDAKTRTVISNEKISTIQTSQGGGRLTLGLAVDPDSTPENTVLWVAHSDGSISNGGFNSGVLTRLSGPGFTQVENVITGLPRAIANHATNNIEFGPDGKLYLWQGGNTGAGAATLAASEFGDRAEQPFSAAVLTVDIPAWKNDAASFDGDAGTLEGEFLDEFLTRKESELGRPYTEVQVYATGLRNTYDGVFHSSGNIYAPDNGLGVTGTAPPVPRLGDPTDRSITTLLGDNPTDNPGPQIDPLNRVIEGGYYGHPNPYRDEVVFKDGTFQGLAPDADWQGHFGVLGNKLSANGIIEYTADNLFGQLQSDLLITSFSSGDNVIRVEVSEDGTALIQQSSLTGGFSDPLPIEMGPDGTVFVGEFNGGKITVLEPLGLWRSDLPEVPVDILDPGSGVLDDKLYLVGGKNGTGHLNSTYIYDPGNPFISTDDTWTLGAVLPGDGIENPAVVGLDGQLYVFGGSTAPFSGAVANAFALTPDIDPSPDVVTPRWDSIAPMLTARGGATAQVVDGDIYVIGGMDASGASVDTIEIYDPITNMWTVGPEMQTRRDNAGTAVIDGKLYVFGGRTRNADGTIVEGTLDTLEIFNPITADWSFGASMPTGRRTMIVGTIDNKIQVIGGEAGPGGSAFSQNEEYDPLSDTWRELPSITTPRHGAAFGTIDDVIYAAGGGIVAGGSFSNVVEAFTN